MRKFLITLLMVVGFLQAQTPIIRLMQSREYKTPKYWWRDQETFKLRGYLADDTTGMNTANAASGVAYKNNNFDAWRDSVMTVAVTLDDNGASVTAFRLDLIFDNDLITWDNTTLTGHDSTRVEKGAYIAGWTEGDSSAGAHYSYEVTWYNNVGYNDSLAAAGSEISTSNNRYDWLRITMVSHNGGVKTFANGNGTQTELLKLHFKVDDVVDNFAPRAFRVATKYDGSTGYYTYVTNGNYATNYKVYIEEPLKTTYKDIDVYKLTTWVQSPVLLQSLNMVENIAGIKIKKKILKQNRVGDHIWYISNTKKFKKKYPNWKQKFSTRSIITELIDQFS